MSSELVAVELQLKGYEGVMSDMRALDRMLNGFRGKKNRIEVESCLSEAKKEVIALQGELNKLNSIKLNLGEYGKSSEGLNNKIKETRERLRDAQQAVKEFQYALKNLSGKSFTQAFDWISSRMAHLGSAMQSAGNALTRLTTPFARFTSGMVMGAGYKALNKFTEGLENGFNRYDTMKKYPKIMAAFGYSNEESQKSIEALDKSVRGLPTGLDEMVDMSQRFTATTGSIEKGTKLAIAANNAFLASMSTDTQKYQGMMQLQDVLGGKDMNAREWNSLVSSMTPAIVKMGESLGYTKDNMDEFIQTVRDGDMSNQDFIDQLIKIGNEGGVLEKMAQESKNTWQAFFANIGNAASRMTAGVIQAFDEISQSVTGKDVNQLLADTVIPGIDKMTESVKGWIKAHPEEITDFFKSLGSINWKSIGRGVAEGIQWVAGLVKQFADIFGGKDLSRIGRWMIKGNIFGNALTILGGLIKGSRGIIATIGATGFKGVQTIKNIRKAGGIAGWLGTLAIGDNASKTEKTIETVANASPKMGKFSTGLSKIFTGWAQVATMIGGSAFVAWGSMKLIKGAVKSFKETVDVLNKVDWDMGAKALGGITVFIGAMAGLSKLAGHFVGGSVEMLIGEVIVGAFTTLAAGIADIDMALIKRTFKHFAKATEYLNEAIDNLNNVKTVGNVKDKVGNAISTFNEIISILKPKRTDKQTVDGGMQKLGGEIVKSLKNLKDSLSTINDSVGLINTLNNTKLESGNIEDLTKRIGTSIGFIAGMFDRMPESMQNGDAVEIATNLKTSMANFNKSLGSIVGENGILARIPQVLQSMTNLVSKGKLDVFQNDMARLGDVLTSVYNSLQGIGNGQYFASNIDGFREGLKSMKFAIKHLQEISGMEVGSDVVGKIQGIIKNIESAFDVGAIDRVKTNIESLVTSIKDALATFEELNTEIEINPTVKVGSGFDSSVTKAVGKINKGKGKISSAVNSIPSNYYKNVRVHVAVSAIVSGIEATVRTANQGAQAAVNRIKANIHANGGATGGQFSRNGVLYRSGGGSIFKPRGVDKIPAMLAEGEYVHKKQAVDFFGVDFMRKVNNMDVRGAMESLLTKAGTSIGVGRQSIVNNTVNNNQRITQHINTNNPNFAKARMGRFVGAL